MSELNCNCDPNILNPQLPNQGSVLDNVPNAGDAQSLLNSAKSKIPNPQLPSPPPTPTIPTPPPQPTLDSIIGSADTKNPQFNLQQATPPALPTAPNFDTSFGSLDAKFQNPACSGEIKNNLSFGNSDISSPSSSINFGTPKLQPLGTKINNGLDFGVNSLKSGVSSGLGGVASGATSIAGNVGEVGNSIKGLNPLNNIRGASSLKISPVSQTTALQGIANRCANKVIDALDNLDPTAKLEALMDKASSLCVAGDYSKLRGVLDRIQSAKREIIQQGMDALNTPFERLNYLSSKLSDAINTGAEDLIGEITGMMKFEAFNSTLNQLFELDPRQALETLNAKIKEMTQLKQFAQVRELLATIDLVKNRVGEIQSEVNNQINAQFDRFNQLLQEPENLLNSVQSKIDEALNLNNYAEIQAILDAYDSVVETVQSIIQELDPRVALEKGLALANEALANLDYSKYTKILDDMANRLCGEELDGLLSNIPKDPYPDVSNIPSAGQALNNQVNIPGLNIS